jgi:hypothetical protein
MLARGIGCVVDLKRAVCDWRGGSWIYWVIGHGVSPVKNFSRYIDNEGVIDMWGLMGAGVLVV